MYLKFLIFTLSSFCALGAYTEFKSCGTHQIDSIMVQGNRDDNHIHANSFVMTLRDYQCNDKPYLILKNNQPSYQGMLSIALAAKLAGKEVHVTVNTSEDMGSATEISIIIVQ